jgi:hypothetical protein
MVSPLEHEFTMSHVIVEVPTATHDVPLQVVPVGHPQSEQHDAVVSVPLQAPSPQTWLGGAVWHLLDRQTSGLQQSAVVAQVVFAVLHDGGAAQTLFVQIRESQQSVVVAQASVDARHVGGAAQTLLVQISELQQSAVVAQASVDARHIGPLPPLSPLPHPHNIAANTSTPSFPIVAPVLRNAQDRRLALSADPCDAAATF